MQPEMHSLVAAERLRDDHGVRQEETPPPALRTALRPCQREAKAPLPPRR